MENTCQICLKSFKTKSGLKGHEFRSHINRDKQSLYGSKGTPKRIELGHSFHMSHTIEHKEKMSKLMVERLHKKKFWSKREIYKGITLDSSYEVVVAKSLDEHNIKWTRPAKAFRYFDGIQHRHYLPDFYLPEYNVYLDPKNDYLIKKDQRKISLASNQNNVRIVILDKNNLEWKNIALMV